MDFWTTEYTVKEDVLRQAQTQVDIASALPVIGAEVQDNTARICDLKEELFEMKEVAERDSSH